MDSRSTKAERIEKLKKTKTTENKNSIAVMVRRR